MNGVKIGLATVITKSFSSIVLSPIRRGLLQVSAASSEAVVITTSKAVAGRRSALVGKLMPAIRGPVSES